MDLSIYRDSIRNQTKRYTIENYNFGGTLTGKFTYATDNVVGGILSGTKNPNWRGQIARVENASTDLSAWRLRHSTKQSFCSENFGVDGPSNPLWESRKSWYGDFPVPLAYDPEPYMSSEVSKATNRAKSEFVNKARQHQTATYGGIQLGELRNTIRMIRSPAQSLRKGVGSYLRSVKENARSIRKTRKRVDRARELSQMATDTWLEYSLGWRPMVNDLSGAIEALKTTDDYLSAKRIMGFGEVEVPALASRYRQTHSPGWYIDLKAINKVTVKYYGAIGAGPSAAGYAARRVGLDVNAVLPTAWELVPYSFVSDYFVNVGDIINAYSLNTSTLRWVSKVVRVEMDRKYVFNERLYVWPETWTYGSGSNAWRIDEASSPGACRSIYTKVTRHRNAGSLVPSLEFSLPFAGTQWLNLAALTNASKSIRELVRV